MKVFSQTRDLCPTQGYSALYNFTTQDLIDHFLQPSLATTLAVEKLSENGTTCLTICVFIQARDPTSAQSKVASTHLINLQIRKNI